LGKEELYETWKKVWVRKDRKVNPDAPVVNFKIDGVVARISLLTHAAPETCKAILERLPIKGHIIHGCWSGDMVRSLEFVDYGKVPFENQTGYPIEGDFCYYPPHKELTFSYGEARATMPYGPIDVSVVGRVITKLDELTDVFRLTRLEGAKEYIITLAE
jgi:hypothetical protein